MLPAAHRTRLLTAPAALALIVAIVGCASAGPSDPADPDAEPVAPVESTADPDAERRAAECVAGAWVAEAPALQAFFDRALAEAGVSDYRLIATGSIVYEFIEHGFGFTVLPTEFGMRMPTGFGDVNGTISGRVSWHVGGVFFCSTTRWRSRSRRSRGCAWGARRGRARRASTLMTTRSRPLSPRPR